MRKIISLYQNKYILDQDTQEGRDLYAAYCLITMFGMPATPEDALPQEAKNELNRMRSVGEDLATPSNTSFMAAANLSAKYNSALSHLIAFHAYRNLPAVFRPLAISEMQQALEMGSGTPFDVYMQGLQLAKEYRFDEALAHIQVAISKEPQNPLYYRWAADVLVKMNELDYALRVLYAYRDGEYYKAGHVIDGMGLPIRTQQMIDVTIKEIEDKKTRGYVYRPRKKQA